MRTTTPSVTNAVLSAVNALASIDASDASCDSTKPGSVTSAWLSVEISTSAGSSANDDRPRANRPSTNTRRLHDSSTTWGASVEGSTAESAPLTVPNDDSAIGATDV